MSTDIDTLSGRELDDLPGDFGPVFPEPQCWGERSYEHARGECRHFEAERPPAGHSFDRNNTDGYCDLCGQPWEAH